MFTPSVCHSVRPLLPSLLHLQPMYSMHILARRLSRRILSSLATKFEKKSSLCSSFPTSNPSFTTFTVQTHRPKFQNGINMDFLKWGSLGFYRTSSFATGFNPLQRKQLDSIIDIERVKDRTPEEISAIWDDYHLGRGHIGATMKANLYHLLAQRAADCRYFVVPMWRGSGYITMFAQVQMPHMLLTGLEDYKARGTQAAPYFTLTYYTEFADTKDLVLIRGDIVFTSKLTDSEAWSLIETVQSFYLNDTQYKLVERFNKSTSEFEFKDVLQALDMPAL